MKPSEYKEYLQDHIEGTAYWRGLKSEEHPDDRRNHASAESLAKLARAMEEVSDESELLEYLSELDAATASMPDDGLEFAEILSNSLRRYGFDGLEDGDPEQFLRRLITLYKHSIDTHEQYEKIAEAARIAALPILFVEGTTDAIIIGAAWRALFPSAELPVNIHVSDGTKQMHSLAGSGRALGQILPDKDVLVLVDNDRDGRALVHDGHLHKGGAWRQLTSGIHWCLLKPTEEFVTTMSQLQIPQRCWPCTIEACFSVGVRRRAENEGAYAFSGHLMDELYGEGEVSKRAFAAARARSQADDAYFYLMAPTPSGKEAFANWIATQGVLTPSDFSAFAPVFAGLRNILSQEE